MPNISPGGLDGAMGLFSTTPVMIHSHSCGFDSRGLGVRFGLLVVMPPELAPAKVEYEASSWSGGDVSVLSLLRSAAQLAIVGMFSTAVVTSRGIDQFLKR
jgi:hypothetical protein